MIESEVVYLFVTHLLVGFAVKGLIGGGTIIVVDVAKKIIGIFTKLIFMFKNVCIVRAY